MNKAYIFGNGGHARVIASVLSCDVVFVVAGPAKAGNEVSQQAFLADLPGNDIYIGIGDNAIRTRIFNELKTLGRSPAICVAPTAFVARDASLAVGAVILAGAVVGSRAVICENAIVNTLSSVDHDGYLGAHSSVTVGVTFGGAVRTGTSCFFGMKSAVIPGITIGNNVTVAAGSLVTKSVPDNVMVGGSPARQIRALADETT